VVLRSLLLASAMNHDTVTPPSPRFKPPLSPFSSCPACRHFIECFANVRGEASPFASEIGGARADHESKSKR
jgi:hypothetical protein